MMAKARRVPLDPVADLRRRLVRSPGRKARACIRAWWVEHGLGAHPAAVGKRIAIALIEQRAVEDKRAGILVLDELLGDQLRASDLPAFARLFARGHLADVELVDRFAARILAMLLDRAQGREEVARVLVQWRAATTPWQRRASCGAFARIAATGERALPGVIGMVFMMCATIVWSHHATDQEAVGALLRELSRAHPERVELFVRRYARLMSRPCARSATAQLPSETRGELLAYHRRATSLM